MDETTSALREMWATAKAMGGADGKTLESIATTVVYGPLSVAAGLYDRAPESVRAAVPAVIRWLLKVGV